MQTLPFSVLAAWRGVYPCSCRKRYTPDRCSYRLPPTFGSACFWESFRYPKVDMDRHYRQVWQAGANPSRIAGTSHRTSEGLSAGVRPPAASSWCVPNTFHPVTTYAHVLHRDDVSPSASPQSIWYTAQPSRIVAVDRLPPARLLLHGGCPVLTRNRSP